MWRCQHIEWLGRYLPLSPYVAELGGTPEFKLYNKLDALEKMGRHLGMFPNKHEHGSDPDKPLTLQVITGVPEKE